MMNLLVFKERIIKIYQKTEFYLIPGIKFLVSLITFSFINGQIGFDARLKSLPVLLLLSVLGAFTPSSVLVLLAAILSVAHIYFVSKILAVLLLVIFLILYFLFVRFTPRQGYVVVAIPILYLCNMHYVIPLLLGITAGPVTMVSAGCGIVVFYVLKVVKEAAATTISTSVEDILALYKYVLDSLLGNKEMLLAIMVFAVVILVTYIIRKCKFDYAFYIAIGTGVLTSILSFLIGDLQLNISNQIGSMILGSLASGFIVLVIQFFRLTLDYTAVERTQFEDDDYYYYVKAVPKMKVTVPKKNVQKINVQKTTGNTVDLGQSIKKISEEEELDLDFIRNYKQDYQKELRTGHKTQYDEEMDDYSDLEPYSHENSINQRRSMETRSRDNGNRSRK